jgi:hypothetical protein
MSNNNDEMIDYLLEMDDNTYEYGNKMFKILCDKNGNHIEPYIREEPNNRIVKFYKNKNFFVIYDNNIISEIIHVETCWTDDYIAYRIGPDKVAYDITEYYHGHPLFFFKKCNIDMSNFIADNEL